jgi:4-hydroxybenzoate polyprenyltransferase
LPCRRSPADPRLALVGLYCAITLSYSLSLKRVPLLDVTVLAMLFTLRLVIGAALAGVLLSSWLLVFSMFLFFSLALAKRSTEIGRSTAKQAAAVPLHGRGYLPADAPLIQSLGASSAIAAVVIMVLYLVEEAFPNALYSSPELLWFAPAAIGLWLGRVWLLCARGLLNDDPVQFAVRDRLSILLGASVVASFFSAAAF